MCERGERAQEEWRDCRESNPSATAILYHSYTLSLCLSYTRTLLKSYPHQRTQTCSHVHTRVRTCVHTLIHADSCTNEHPSTHQHTLVLCASSSIAGHFVEAGQRAAGPNGITQMIVWRCVGAARAKAAQAGFPHQGQTRPRKRRRIFGRRATNIQCHPRQRAMHILKGIVLEGPTHVSVLF